MKDLGRFQDTAISISSYPSSKRQRRAAIIIGLLLIIIVAFTLPLARSPGIVSQILLAMFITSVCFCELVTAFLMYSEFLVTRSPASLLLAAAYLFTGLISIPHLLTFPGVFTESGLLNAGSQTATWLWVFWHGGYPFFVFLHVLVYKWRGTVQLSRKRAGTIGAVTLISILLLAVLFTFISIYGTHLLPVLIKQNNFSVLITSGVGLWLWFLNIMALGSLIFLMKGKTVLHVWLTVAVLASFLDVTLSLFSGNRYSIGWYMARFNSLLSACILLGTLLYEIRTLYYRIAQQERIFRTVFEFAAVGIARINLDRKPIEANQAFQQMLGYRESELQHKSLSDLTHPDDLKKDEGLMEQLVEGKIKNYAVEKRYFHKNGGFIWGNSIVSIVRGASDQPEFFIGMVEDITKRKEYEEQMRFQAYHDALTRLPNRLLFTERLNQAIIKAIPMSQKVAVLFLDLDGFKKVNDSLGHDMGDRLLQLVTERLKSVVGTDDTVARMGGDEFTMILTDLQDIADALEVSDKILELITDPFQMDGHEIKVSTSIGISIYPYHGEDVQTLMKHADTAMYKSKEAGKNQYTIYAEIG